MDPPFSSRPHGHVAAKLLDAESMEIGAKNGIIATSSEVAPFPGGAIQIDKDQIGGSTGAPSLQKVSDKMVAIGGGLEMGSVWDLR